MKRILVVFLLIFTYLLMAEEIAIFSKIQGGIFTEQDTLKNFHKVGDVIENNSIIYSQEDSYALVHYKFTNGTLRIFPNSAVNIVSIDSLNTKVSLSKGRILNDLKEKIKGSYTVETNSTVASVRGTAFEVFLTEEGTDINVVEGNVDVLNKISGQSHSLGANQRLISRNSGELVELTLEGNPISPREEGSEEIEEAPGDGEQSGVSDSDLPNLATSSLPAKPISITPVITTPVITNPDKAENEDVTKEQVSVNTKKDGMEVKEDSSSPYPIAVVLKVKGNLLLIRNKQELECPVGTLLENEDKLRTDDNSLALVKFVDNSSQIRVFSNSEVTINVEKDKEILNKSLKLDGGSILSNVNKKIVGKYSVSTTSTIASVRGTEFLVELKDGITRVIGFSGKVEVENKKSGEKSLVTKGNTVTSTEDGTVDRQETNDVPADVNEELQSIEYENTMKIKFENEDGSIKTIILEY